MEVCEKKPFGKVKIVHTNVFNYSLIRSEIKGCFFVIEGDLGKVLILIAILIWGESSAGISWQGQVVRPSPGDYEVLLDYDHDFSPNDIMEGRLPFSSNLDPDSLFADNPTYWLRFALKNTLHDDQELVLLMRNALVEHIEVYVVSKNHRFIYSIGETSDPDSRPISYRLPVIPIHLKGGGTSEVYFKLRSKYRMQFPFEIYEQRDFQKVASASDHIISLTMGVLFILTVYNFFVWLKVRAEAYGSFVLFTLFVNLTIYLHSGYVRQAFDFSGIPFLVMNDTNVIIGFCQARHILYCFLKRL